MDVFKKLKYGDVVMSGIDNTMVVGELRRLLATIKSGDLMARADNSNFQGETAEIMSLVNELISTTADCSADSNIKDISDFSQDILIISKTDPAGYITYVNDLFCEVSGYRREELIGKRQSIIRHPSMPKETFIDMWATIQAKRAWEGVITNRAKNGDEYIVRSFIKPTLNAKGEIVEYIGIRQNITKEMSEVRTLTVGVDSLLSGNFKNQITANFDNIIYTQLKDSINNTMYSLDKMVQDTQKIITNAADGQLTYRASDNQYVGGYKDIVGGVNGMLDIIYAAVVGDGVNTLLKLSGGDLSTRITTEYKGDYDVFKRAVNDVHSWLSGLVEYVTKIANGDMTAEMPKASENDQIHEYLILMRDSIKALVSDANMLSVAAVEGRLSTRADATKHQGDFRKIVEGVNGTLDAVINPLNVAANYVERISNGDIPTPITDNYNGDFKTIKNNLNHCIGAVNALVADAGMLSVAAVEGRLSTRADATKHQGDFRKIVEGVNGTLDAVINPLNVAANYVERISNGDIPTPITDSYNGDFNTIKNNLNQCIGAVNALVADAGMLSVAAVEGRLSTRADATKHQGDFRKIVEGVNNTLDAVINPLNVAANYVDNIAKGNTPVKITDTYNGDFNILKNNLNTCIDSINQQTEAAKGIAAGDFSVKIDVRSENDEQSKSLIQIIDVLKGLQNEMQRLTEASTEGQLRYRANADTFKGGYKDIVGGVNRMLDIIYAAVVTLPYAHIYFYDKNQ